jgi:hypothetical protein
MVVATGVENPPRVYGGPSDRGMEEGFVVLDGVGAEIRQPVIE